MVDDKGAEARGTVSVEVENVAPSVAVDAFVKSQAVIDEGDIFFAEGFIADPGPDDWTAEVDYGDGSQAQLISVSGDPTFFLEHVYLNDGEFDVTVEVSDNDGGFARIAGFVTVSNVVPVVFLDPNTTI